MAKTAKSNSAKSSEGKVKKRSSGLKVLVFITLISVMLVVLKMGVIFCILALLPAIVAHYVDQTPTRYIFHTVLSCNLAAVLPFLGQILSSSSSDAEVLAVMSRGINWLIIYSAAGFGWILVFSAPAAAKSFINLLHKRQINKLDQTQRRILAQWGKEVELFHAKEMNSPLNAKPVLKSSENSG
jgi:cell division protein FtsW (lipid II flippase)